MIYMSDVGVYHVLSVCSVIIAFYVFFFKQKTAYEMRISDWSSDVCSSDLEYANGPRGHAVGEILRLAIGIVAPVKGGDARGPTAADLGLERRGDSEGVEPIGHDRSARRDRTVNEKTAHRGHIAALIDRLRLHPHSRNPLQLGTQQNLEARR